MEIQEQTLKRIEKLEKEVSYMKSNMVDSDSILDEDYHKAVLEYRKEKGTLTSHKQLKKELGL